MKLGLGVYYDVPENDYFKIDALSQSGLKELEKSGAHYKAYRENGIRQSPKIRFGKLVHALALEPKIFEKKVAVIDGSRNSKAVKGEIAAAEANNKLVCKSTELEDCKGAVEALKSHDLVKNIFDGADHEVSMFWNDENDNYCKARFDIVNLSKNCIFDLKVTGIDLSKPFKVRNHIYDMKYHWQIAFYKSAAEQLFDKKFKYNGLIFIEDKPPYGIKPYIINEHTLDLALREMEPVIESYKKCVETNNWDSYEEKIYEGEVPDFAFEIIG